MKKSVLMVKSNLSGGYIDFDNSADLNGCVIDTKEKAYYYEDNDDMLDEINSPFKALEIEMMDPYMNDFYKVHADAHFLNVNKDEITFGFEGTYGAFFKVHVKNDLSVYAERFENEEQYLACSPYFKEEWKFIKQEHIMPTIILWEDDMMNNYINS